MAGEEGDEFVDRSGGVGPGVDPGRGLAGHQRMGVGIDEAGQERSTAEVDLVAVAPEGEAAIGERAGMNDPLVRDRDRLDPERLGHGQDRAAREEHTGRPDPATHLDLSLWGPGPGLRPPVRRATNALVPWPGPARKVAWRAPADHNRSPQPGEDPR